MNKKKINKTGIISIETNQTSIFMKIQCVISISDENELKYYYIFSIYKNNSSHTHKMKTLIPG